MSGPAASWGIEMDRALKMAVDKINAGGGFVAGGQRYQWEIITYDTAYVPSKAADAVTKLVEKDKVKFMPRIAGINIPENKKIAISLSYIYGIGSSLAKKIISDLKINLSKKASDLTAEELNRLKDLVEKQYKIEGELKRIVQSNIKRL